MEFQLPFTIPPAAFRIVHPDAVILSGSCFSEHIGSRLTTGKFPLISNPHGILFNPASLASGLEACVNGKVYNDDDIFLLNGVWNSWDFHSAYSAVDMNTALSRMNASVEEAGNMIKTARCLIITFGSAYQYFLKAEYTGDNKSCAVSNCHKAPGQWFDKQMLETVAMLEQWTDLVQKLHYVNPRLQIIFTVSPVRHYRDGLAENNRSKGRLLELAHTLSEQYGHCHYFPAYELVQDVLRDYRFFDADMVHPNAQAVQYVWERFSETYMSQETRQLLKRLQEVTLAMRHTERFPGTESSRKFREGMLKKVIQLKQDFPFLYLEREQEHFSKMSDV